MIFKKTTRKTQPDFLGHLVEMLWSASTVVSFNFRFSQGKKKKEKIPRILLEFTLKIILY